LWARPGKSTFLRAFFILRIPGFLFEIGTILRRTAAPGLRPRIQYSLLRTSVSLFLDVT
jgi:hypothetical protein